MTSQITVTAKVGPGKTVTALVLTNVKGINFQVDKGILSVTDSGGVIHDFDIMAATTVTDTVSSGSHTFVVS